MNLLWPSWLDCRVPTTPCTSRLKTLSAYLENIAWIKSSWYYSRNIGGTFVIMSPHSKYWGDVSPIPYGLTPLLMFVCESRFTGTHIHAQRYLVVCCRPVYKPELLGSAIHFPGLLVVSNVKAQCCSILRSAACHCIILSLTFDFLSWKLANQLLLLMNFLTNFVFFGVLFSFLRPIMQPVASLRQPLCSGIESKVWPAQIPRLTPFADSISVTLFKSRIPQLTVVVRTSLEWLNGHLFR